MSIRTDLAVEAVEFAGEQMPEGVVRSEEERNGVKITRVEVVDETAAQQVGKPIGKYVTVSVSSFERAAQNYEDEITAIAEEIEAMLPKEGLVLVVGLGNNDITPDALGPKTIDHTLAIFLRKWQKVSDWRACAARLPLLPACWDRQELKPLKSFYL